jgi:hypothetical protein
MGRSLLQRGEPVSIDLRSIATQANGRDADDAWGNPIELLCGAHLPPGPRHIALVSAGPDGEDGTGDDLRSWQRRVTERPGVR